MSVHLLVYKCFVFNRSFQFKHHGLGKSMLNEILGLLLVSLKEIFSAHIYFFKYALKKPSTNIFIRMMGTKVVLPSECL